MLVPKTNQDNFRVMKGFPANTKAFNWLFAIYDGHGPNGEMISQYAAQIMPELLNKHLKLVNAEFGVQIETLQLKMAEMKKTLDNPQ